MGAGPKHNCNIPELGEQILYMLPLLHPEDIDKEFVLKHQVF